MPEGAYPSAGFGRSAARNNEKREILPERAGRCFPSVERIGFFLACVDTSLIQKTSCTHTHMLYLFGCDGRGVSAHSSFDFNTAIFCRQAILPGGKFF